MKDGPSRNVKTKFRNRSGSAVYLEFSLASKHCSFTMQSREAFKGHLSQSFPVVADYVPTCTAES